MQIITLLHKNILREVLMIWSQIITLILFLEH